MKRWIALVIVLILLVSFFALYSDYNKQEPFRDGTIKRTQVFLAKDLDSAPNVSQVTIGLDQVDELSYRETGREVVRARAGWNGKDYNVLVPQPRRKDDIVLEVREGEMCRTFLFFKVPTGGTWREFFPYIE